MRRSLIHLQARAALHLVLASMLTGPTLAADSPRDLLARTAEAYQALPAYSDRGEFVLTLQLDGKTHSTSQHVAITLARPNRIRIEAESASLVSDGETLTTLVGPTRKYTAEPAPKTLRMQHVADGPVGSLLLGGPSGPPLSMLLGLFLSEDPIRGILDLGGEMKLEADVAIEGKECHVLRIDSAEGTAFRLFIDREMKLVREIGVELSRGALEKLLPLGGRLAVSSYRWRAGLISTDAPDGDVFRVRVPKDFTKVGGPVAPAAVSPARKLALNSR